MSLSNRPASGLGIDCSAPGTLFCFGLGYTGAALAGALVDDGWRVRGTVREASDCEALAADGIDARPFDDIGKSLADVTHLLSCVPPMAGEGDPVLARYESDIVALAPELAWAGYLSTTGVYGNRAGDLVDETSPSRPTSERAARRVTAETAWREMHVTAALPVHVFRLAGIYGPDRNALETVKTGRARRIVKPNQVFSRIHLDDLVTILRASMTSPRPGAIYNVCDDEPAPPQDVIAYACKLLGVAPPPEEDFDTAEMTEMARSFYADNKRVTNRLIGEELGVRLAYPNYRVGLDALAS